MEVDIMAGDCEDRDQICPLYDPEVMAQLAVEKKENPSKFVSFWEMDEEDVDEATEEEIRNDPALRTLWAAEKGELDELKALLEKDSGLIHSVDADGYTALHRAAYENNTHILQYLLEHGSELEKKTNDGWTALHSGAMWGQSEAVALLLSHGADINAQTNGKQTALHLAASSSPASRETLQLLLLHPDCDCSLKNSVGETALDVGRRCSQFYCLFDACEDSVNRLC